MASQPRLQVLAASKNKISALKGFPYLPSLSNLFNFLDFLCNEASTRSISFTFCINFNKKCVDFADT
ncbi:hypothetical protein P3L10_018189 [Capsicum annuum]